MSKWKCGICGSEFENYHAQGFDDIIYCPLCYFKEIYKREQKKTKLLQNQLQQKENIIKEAIEYHDNCVNNLLDLDKIDENERLAYKVAYEIHDNYLKILKEKNNA